MTSNTENTLALHNGKNHLPLKEGQSNTVKAKAGERGYQTLINQALHQAMTGEQIESTLRRVIREELHPT